VKNVLEGLDGKKGTESREPAIGETGKPGRINGNKEPGKKFKPILERRKMEWVYVGTEK
jgi:hypothetical protein